MPDDRVSHTAATELVENERRHPPIMKSWQHRQTAGQLAGAAAVDFTQA